jgi:alpha-amylase/alpha-mannosidase (GH57 family)
MKLRYVCIHGHFYQPPRENPWTGRVEKQESAAPYHDWNGRITAECYAPNAEAKILDDDDNPGKTVNNYAHISFNFGPTLLSWMEEHARKTYDRILEADRQFGSALAQAYHHVILPLADTRDKHTQVIWGIRDFEHRFGRKPRGMWLPETAVDLESLDVLAEHGIGFTILAPHQARRVRAAKDDTWIEIDGDRVDPSRPYVVRLPSNRTITVWFYDGPVSGAVAFERLLHSGQGFADRLLSAFDVERTGPQLVHIATDGETYGHHHRHGEMALAHALEILAERDDVELTHYGACLDKHPPSWNAEIVEDSSWSCGHGVERWRNDCGCADGPEGSDQAWRAPLREALDWLRDRLVEPWEREASRWLRDPWVARDNFIDVILDPTVESRHRFLERHALRQLSVQNSARVRQLLELQHQAMLMYTSCGWFFDDISRIETVQILRYAARAIELARDSLGLDLEGELMYRLSRAVSNVAEEGDGREIYRRNINASHRARRPSG